MSTPRRRAGDGPRHAGHPRGDRAVLHRHPPGTAPDPGAPRRAGRPVPGHRGHVAPGPSGPGRRSRGWPPRSRPGPPGGSSCATGPSTPEPTIEEGVSALAGAGVGRVIGIVLTPHQSSLGSGEYFRRAEAAAASAEPPLELTAGPLVAPRRRLRPSAGRPDGRRPVGRSGAGGHTRTAVFFTAHSLPLRAVAEGDPYPDQVAESAADIAALLDLDDEPGLTWGVAWQSAGRTAEPWIGPDLLDEIRRVAAEGATAVLVCPVGFVSDHLEVLYDLDIEAEQVARSVGVRLRPDPVAQRRPALPRPAGHRGPAGRRSRGASPVARVVERHGPCGVTAPSRPTVAVVGGGIAGLAAAWELVAGRRSAADGPPPEVIVLEADGRLGGKLRAERVRRPTGGPGRRRLPGPPARGHRALRPARPVRGAGAGGGHRGVDLGPGPAPAHARRPVPRRAHPLAAAGPHGHPRPGRGPAGGQGPGPPPPRAPARAPGTGRSGRSWRSGSADRWWTDWPTR